MRSFSSLVMEAPGDCSPSRKVVSKMISLSLISNLRYVAPMTTLEKNPQPKNKRPVAGANGPLLEITRASPRLPLKDTQ
jgi:hypothetical protein